MSAGANNDEGGQDFDLNLAPIIDCFTVLIAYLLVSASFISLAVFDVGVAISGDGATPNTAPKDPPYFMSIQISSEHLIEIKVGGGPDSINITKRVEPSQKRFDLLSLKDQLEELKSTYPSIEEVSVSADSATMYRDIINVIETAKAPFPKVFLSGEQVNLVEKVSSKPNEEAVQ